MDQIGISDQVKQLRRDLGVSQLELGRLVGADPATVSRWERGIATPSREHYERLCRLQTLARPMRCRRCRIEGMARVELAAGSWALRCRLCGHVLRTVPAE